MYKVKIMEWIAMKFRWKMYGTEIIQKARPKKARLKWTFVKRLA